MHADKTHSLGSGSSNSGYNQAVETIRAAETDLKGVGSVKACHESELAAAATAAALSRKTVVPLIKSGFSLVRLRFPASHSLSWQQR